MTDDLAASALPALNLARAERLGLDMVIPCAGCYNRQAVVNKKMRDDEAYAAKINEITEEPYGGTIETFALLDVLANKVDEALITEKMVKPLEGLKVASYYGCQLVRPPEACNFDDPENPVSMDRLVKLLGAEVVEWGHKVSCCGASLALSRTDIAEKRCNRIAKAARAAGADCLAVACPLCHANMEQRPGEDGIPVFYITELMGLAFGIDHKKLGINRHCLDARPLLKERGLI
jgi:heterodisulfide reductase subunit B